MHKTLSLALGLALCVSQGALAEDAADRAVAAAQQYSGTTLSLHTEAGLQALGWELYNAKKWEELTGIKIEITSAPVNEMFVTTVQDFRGPANYDVLDVAPCLSAGSGGNGRHRSRRRVDGRRTATARSTRTSPKPTRDGASTRATCTAFPTTATCTS